MTGTRKAGTAHDVVSFLGVSKMNGLLGKWPPLPLHVLVVTVPTVFVANCSSKSRIKSPSTVMTFRFRQQCAFLLIAAKSYQTDPPKSPVGR